MICLTVTAMGDGEPQAEMPYEVDDEVAVLSAAFGRQNQQSFLYLTLAVVVTTVFIYTLTCTY